MEPVTVGPVAPLEAAGSGRASSLRYSQLELTSNNEAFKGTKFDTNKKPQSYNVRPVGPAGPGRAVSLCTNKPFSYKIVPVEPAGPGGAFSLGQYSQNVKAFQPKLRLIFGQGGPHSYNEAVQQSAELKPVKPSSFNRNYKVGKATIQTSKNANIYVYVYVDVSKGTSTTTIDSPERRFYH